MDVCLFPRRYGKLIFLGKRAWLTVSSGDIGSQSPRAIAIEKIVRYVKPRWRH